ncbi:MarR family winged helix-turn-helix transcriptional regulator [Streptomyces albipurpureus]|uniref:MarR family winged helix-turn-helix transcriptional regulator n=1 Tax=Streptomyces albipurpureus TaxID=2897419 RepID=A0ABT0UQ85_9ACTN|nr:MarR family winged helix-turn-helix transcriptional regulator [Streptomyces sp. CWNU-1]MCM2390526.1 MarR family winged helix-turn-helix transcriptional regulator [Streptomyces sp. CWNU-1]
MNAETQFLNEPEGRAWRSYLQMHSALTARTGRLLSRESGLSVADYEILVTLASSPEGRMSSQEVRCGLAWEKSRLSHQVRRMEERGLVAREVNPVDARSAVLCLTARGREVIDEAVPRHMEHVRAHFIALLTPAELELLTRLGERVTNHLACENALDPAGPD